MINSGFSSLRDNQKRGKIGRKYLQGSGLIISELAERTASLPSMIRLFGKKDQVIFHSYHNATDNTNLQTPDYYDRLKRMDEYPDGNQRNQ